MTQQQVMMQPHVLGLVDHAHAATAELLRCGNARWSGRSWINSDSDAPILGGHCSRVKTVPGGASTSSQSKRSYFCALTLGYKGPTRDRFEQGSQPHVRRSAKARKKKWGIR